MSDKLKNNRSFEEMIKDLENSGKDETKKFDELIRDLYTGINKKANMIKEKVNFNNAIKESKQQQTIFDGYGYLQFFEKIIHDSDFRKNRKFVIKEDATITVNVLQISGLLEEAKEILLCLARGRETIYNAYFQRTKDTLEIENLKSEIKDLKNKTHKFDQYKKFYEEYNASAGVISAENKNLLAEIERLKNSNAFVGNHKDTLKVFEKFNFQLNEKQNKINELVDEVNSLINYKELYQKQHPEYKKQLEINDVLNQENEELIEKIERLGKTGGIPTNQQSAAIIIKDLENEIERLKIQFYNSNSTYMDKFGNILTSNEIREIQENFDILTHDFRDLKEDRNRLKSENEELKKQISTACSKDTNAEIENLKKQLEETKYSLEVFIEDRNKYLHLSFNLKDDIESLNKELDKKNIEISILRSLFGKPQWTPQDDFAPSPGPWTATYDTNTNTVSEFKETFSQGCDEFCGMNYCDEYGCIENKAEINSNDLIIIDQLKEKEYQLAPQLPKGYVLHSDGIVSFTAGMMPKVTNIKHVNLDDNIVPTASNTTKVGFCEHTYSADIPEYVKKAADNYPNCKVVKNNVKIEEVDKSISEKYVDCAISQPDEYTPTKEMTTPYLECKNELQGLGVKAEETKAEIPNIRKRRSQPYF